MRAGVGAFLADVIAGLGKSRRWFADRIGVNESLVRRMCDGSVGIDVADCIVGGEVGRDILRAALAENDARSIRRVG